MEKHNAEEAEQLAKDQARKKAYLASEQAIEKAKEIRRLKAKKQPPE